MSLRKQVMKDAGNVPSGNQETDDNSEEEEDQGDDNDELPLTLVSPSSPREKRRRERDNRSKHKEMTEDEMMDLALRLSEQEASISALRRQKEDEAVRKAIQDSMVGQSHSSLANAGASFRISSRQKLLHSNKKSAIDQEVDRTAETPLNGGVKCSAENSKRNKKPKRKAGGPLVEIPVWSKTQRVNSQVSPSSWETLDLQLDSSQSSDSTQIDDRPRSPVFPLTNCQPEVQIPRLNQDLLLTCATSGFVCCSQDGLPHKPEKSPRCLTLPKSPTFSGTNPGDYGDKSPEYLKSPVFSRNPQPVCNSGFSFSSQESLTSSVVSTSCRPHSPVFLGSPGPSPVRSPGLAGTDGGQTRPALSRTGRLQEIQTTGSAALTDSETDQCQDVGFPEVSKSEEETPRGSDEGELTSSMTLHWSEEEDVITPVGSPSPVFSEDRPAPRSHTAATTGTNCRPSSSSSSSGQQQQLPTPERELQPIRSQAAASGAAAPSGEPGGGRTVYYHWGVPFCPRGLDPDDYTQVILAQMEVYEKSLKQAQRGLLRKAEWSEGILPQPEKSPPSELPAESPRQLPQRRLRNKKCDTPAGNDEDEAGEEEEGREPKDEEPQDDDGGQVHSDDCEVCPETQQSVADDDCTQDLTMDGDSGAQLRPKSPAVPKVELMIGDDSAAGEEAQEEEEEEEVQPDPPAGNAAADGSGDRGRQTEEVKEDEEHPDVEEIKDGRLQGSAAPEREPAVDCPICQGSFPATEIEMHAAFCDGDEAATHPRRPDVSPKRKRTRRAEAEGRGGLSDGGRSQEKCFICQKAVPLRDYSSHTELCIQRQTSRRTAKENLLSALEESESRDSEAGPSGSRLQTGDVIDLLDDDGEQSGAAAAPITISNSPIRAFTPISEATDCLVDFKKHERPKKLSRRRR